jgi:plastocyanin
MKQIVGLPLVLMLIGALPMVASAATLKGKVTLKGTPPPEREITTMDPLCTKLHEGKPTPTTRFYVVGEGGGLGDTLVYLREGVNGTFTPPAEAAKLDQVDCEYVPYVMGIQTGQKLMVYNSDPLMHNVHVRAAVAGNRGSNRAQMAKAKPFEYTFTNPEIFIRYQCDVHPWMFAYVAVLPHPFFAVTDENGAFEIKNVPPGKYVVEAIHRRTHPNFKGVVQEITVGEEDATLNFLVDLESK